MNPYKQAKPKNKPKNLQKSLSQFHRIPKNLVMPRLGRLNVDWALAFERQKEIQEDQSWSWELCV